MVDGKWMTLGDYLMQLLMLGEQQLKTRLTVEQEEQGNASKPAPPEMQEYSTQSRQEYIQEHLRLLEERPTGDNALNNDDAAAHQRYLRMQFLLLQRQLQQQQQQLHQRVLAKFDPFVRQQILQQLQEEQQARLQQAQNVAPGAHDSGGGRGTCNGCP